MTGFAFVCPFEVAGRGGGWTGAAVGTFADALLACVPLVRDEYPESLAPSPCADL